MIPGRRVEANVRVVVPLVAVAVADVVALGKIALIPAFSCEAGKRAMKLL
jgi:hypothetical protein